MCGVYGFVLFKWCNNEEWRSCCTKDVFSWEKTTCNRIEKRFQRTSGFDWSPMSQNPHSRDVCSVVVYPPGLGWPLPWGVRGDFSHLSHNSSSAAKSAWIHIARGAIWDLSAFTLFSSFTLYSRRRTNAQRFISYSLVGDPRSCNMEMLEVNNNERARTPRGGERFVYLFTVCLFTCCFPGRPLWGRSQGISWRHWHRYLQLLSRLDKLLSKASSNEK